MMNSFNKAAASSFSYRFGLLGAFCFIVLIQTLQNPHRESPVADSERRKVVRKVGTVERVDFVGSQLVDRTARSCELICLGLFFLRFQY